MACLCRLRSARLATRTLQGNIVVVTEGDDERAPEEVDAAQSRLLHSEKLASLGMLIAGIAHEINTPIGAVRSMHETSARALSKLREALERELPDYRSRPKLERMLAIIEDSNRVASEGSARIIDIVRRVRSFARLDQTALQTVQLEDGLEDTLTLVHHELKHSVTLHRDYAPLPLVDCYPGRLNQVFLNLVMNARQAMGPGGDIYIRTFIDADEACVSIRDTGAGIPPENLLKIFEAGFTTKGEGVGTGLGLSIVKNIVDEHRGRIEVESTVGTGTVFTVRIPVDLAARLDAEADAVDPLDASEVTEPAESGKG